MIPILLEIVTRIGPESWARCLDKDEGEVAEFGYRMRQGRAPFRRYIVKRIALNEGQQLSFDGGAHRYWIFVTNDHESSVLALESEHRHKADVESGMRELKSNFGLHAFRKHGLSWPTGPGCSWSASATTCAVGPSSSDTSGPDETVGISRAKRLRYRYLAVPAMVVRSGRRFTLRLHTAYPYLEQFTADAQPPRGPARPSRLTPKSCAEGRPLASHALMRVHRIGQDFEPGSRDNGTSPRAPSKPSPRPNGTRTGSLRAITGGFE